MTLSKHGISLRGSYEGRLIALPDRLNPVNPVGGVKSIILGLEPGSSQQLG